MMPAYFTFYVWQDGLRVANTRSEDRIYALRDAMHYAWKYEQDGPVVLKEGNRIIYRTPVSQAAAAPDEHA